MPIRARALKFKEHDVYIIPNKEKTFLLYAPTLRKLLRITTNLANKINESKLSLRSADHDVQAVLSSLETALNNAINPFPVHSMKSRYFHLALGLTKRCTLDCIYCHAESGKFEDMPKQILCAALSYAFETTQKDDLKRVNISFAVGGEPTTNWRLFEFCIKQIKLHEKRYNVPALLSITTNGYYSSKIRGFISKYFHNVLLSLDGPPEIQNLHRPARFKKESYTIVRDSAVFFSENANSFAIRSTISNLNVTMMPKIVDFFAKEFGNGFDLVFEPLVPLGRAKLNLGIVGEPDQEEFVKYYIEAKSRGNFHHIEVLTSADNHKRLVTRFCGSMAIPSFTVTTKGIVTTCERDSSGTEYWYGKYRPESMSFTFDEQRIEYNKSIIELPDKCTNCFCKWHCAGDCPDLRIINYSRCSVIKSLVLNELESILDKSNSLESKLTSSISIPRNTC